MKIVSGTSNKSLAQSIAQNLELPVLDVEISKFKNGEKRIWIKENLHGENIVIVQSFSDPADEYIMEFLLLTDALERAGARHLNLVLPWMGYSLQDKVFRPGEPIAAKVVANLISNAYVKRAHLLDVHNTSISGFFSIPTQHHSTLQLFENYVRDTYDTSNAVVVSPDFGGLKRARQLADVLDLELENVDKHRDLKTGKVTPMGLSGDVSNKICIIYDDLINTGSTVVEVARFLKSHGAKEVHFLVTHGLFAGDGLVQMADEHIDSVVITNSIQHTNIPEKIKVIDTGPLFAEAIKPWL